MTNREAYLTALRGGTPDHVPCFFSAVQIISCGRAGDKPYGPPGSCGYDGYGCYQAYNHGANTPDPSYPPAITDITKWREQAVFPDYNFDWEEEARKFFAVRGLDRENYVVDYFSSVGMFERLHFNMGFEEALMALMEEPEAVYDYAGAVADKKIEQIRLVAKYFKPDVYTYMDDYSHLNGLFFSPDTYREIFKPHHKRIVDAAKEEGLIFKQHCCGKFEKLFDDFYDIGIRAFDPCQHLNDLPELKRRHPGEVGFIGGLNCQGVVDMEGVTEEQLRAEVRRCIDTYAPGGGYAVYGASVDIHDRTAFAPDKKLGIISDECARYGADYYKK